MTPIEGFYALCFRGCNVSSTSDGELEVEGPDAVIDEFLPFVRENKSELLALLRDPRKTAYMTWEAAMEEIAGRWDASATQARAHGREPAWFDDEKLTGAFRSAILATADQRSLARALETINEWQRAWRNVLREEKAPLHQGELALWSGAGSVPLTSASESPREYRDRTRDAKGEGRHEGDCEPR